MSTNKSIAKSAGIISLATFCSRILGFLRDMIIARLFGIQIYAQAFVIAFKIPNLLRDSIGEGAANAAFVPVFSEYATQRSQKEFWEITNILLNVMLVVLMSVVLLGMCLSPLLVRIMAPGFIMSPEKLAITITLNRMLFPYILLVSLAAYCMAILNSLKHFLVPAFAPCLLNMSIIVCALVWGEGTRGLASGVLIGGLLQLGVQVPLLYKKGFRYSLSMQFRHPVVALVGKLMLPRFFSSCVYQLNNMVDSIFGSFASIVGEGGVAILYFSYRLILFPVGIVSNALSQAILPTFSAQALEDSRQNLTHSLLWSLRTTLFVMIPASVGFMVLAYPIVSTIFGGGRFDAHSARLTACALVFYSIGLCAYGATKILQSCFFALKDTRTPAKVAFLALVLNCIFNAVFMFPFQIGGIALATSVSGIITFFVLFSILKRKLDSFKAAELGIAFVRVLAASICMGAVCFFAYHYTAGLHKLVSLGIAIFTGIIAYACFCLIFRVKEMKQLLSWIRK